LTIEGDMRATSCVLAGPGDEVSRVPFRPAITASG
jgi:hypothetical protein